MVDNLQDKINALKPYFRGIEMFNDALIVKMQYPPKWKSYGTTDERIKTANDERDPNLVYYYGDSNNTSYEEIFALIEETVKVNQDMKLKLALLKEKFDELKELFSSKSYEELKTLEFHFQEPKKAKRRYTKRKKAAESANEDVSTTVPTEPIGQETEATNE